MIRIIEVGPRDGLQNERQPIATEVKANFINSLVEAGLSEVEVTSFVSPKWVPQLGDALELVSMLPAGPDYSALVPNEKGLERALQTGLDRIAVFTAASDEFTKRNINMTIEESLEAFRPVIERFRAERKNGFVRGYVSTIVECPYAGLIEPKRVAQVVDSLFTLGVDEVSLGETIGVAVPSEIRALIGELTNWPKSRIVWHFHDTRGTAIANVASAMEAGYLAFDSSAAGLGGCPYAQGAGGNMATEDLVYFAERCGVATGVNLEKLAKASLPVLTRLGKPVTAKAQLAALAASSEAP
ncbi:MAG: hydroxymethylglutaryl-CoA lyase [Chthonomonas sp.]|nr:hydroxymethylglutaryl-CoA lyase [Chthonomonas sp.]